ncbi:MAG TPA: transglutaminase-like domain-containing protein [Gemmatimonadales bacterium]|nr:transglutaminase-like domain-containing protein [Gemmatimonadales bacterium]
MTRRRWAAAILVAWAASLGWLVRRELFHSTGARLAEAALSVNPGAVYYRLAVGGQQLGLATTTIDTLASGIRVTDALGLDIPALGVLHRTRAMSRATVSPGLRLESTDTRFEGDFGRFTAHTTVRDDTLLTVQVGTGRDAATTHLSLAHPVALASLLPLRLALAGELKTGHAATFLVFDPLLLQLQSVTLRVATESTLIVPDSAAYDSTAMAWVPAHFDTVRAFGIEAEAGGRRTRAWIDGQGHVVRAENGVGFTTDRAAFEIVYQNFRKRDTVRVVRASATPARGGIVPLTALAAGVPLAPEPGDQWRVRLGGADGAGLELASARQQLVGDTLVVRREAGPELAARYRLPARDTALRAFLTPEPLIQSDDPAILTAARQAVGPERDPTAAARLLLTWVHTHLSRRHAPGEPDAAHVFRAPQGDCNAYTVLYVALARAVGLPARSAAGLVYLRGRFYYHAWPEVYLGAWVSVDPMLGQFPADAGRLRFAVGGLARDAELAPLIGRVKLEVL